MFGKRRNTFYLRFAISFLAVIAMSACGRAQDSDSGFSSTNEMTGLYDPNSPPSSEGEEWTYGPFEQSKGYYSRGSLINPDKMPVEGTGFRLAIPASRVVYATYDLVTIIKNTAVAMEAAYPGQEGLRVGELSAMRGGYANGHDSHQNGLDIDLGYYRAGMGPLPEIEKYTFEAMVRRGKVQKLFDVERNYEFMKMIVRTGRANRIFVHPKIKASLCEYAKSLGENTDINPYLSVIRGWPLHADHMHVRITCPRNSPKCKNQVLPSAETECPVPHPPQKTDSASVTPSNRSKSLAKK